MKHIFVLNPAAGTGKQTDLFEKRISELCAARALAYEIYKTKSEKDASRFVRERCLTNQGETLRFYACGGDGTIGEVVGGAVGFDCAEVAVVPMGTGNDFVRVLGKKEDFLDVEKQLDAEAVPCDVIRIGEDKYCINMMNIGFDGEVAARASRAKKFLPGKMAYICGVVGEFFKMSMAQFRCVMDGKDLGDKKVLLSLYANGGFCGGGFHAAPYAELNDGKMDVCFIRPVPRRVFLKLVGPYRKGTHMLTKEAEKYIEYYKCSDLKLTFDKPQRVCIDGEIEEFTSLHMAVLRDAVRVVLPRGTKPEYEECPPCPHVVTFS